MGRSILTGSVPTYYSSGLSLQALGLKMHRHAATLVDLVVATGLTLYIVLVQDFTTALDDFIALLIAWVGPFGGVWITDGFLRHGRYDAGDIHARAGSGRYAGWHGINPAGCAAMAAGMLAAALTMKSPLYDGPIAVALGGMDLSWLVGFPVSMLSYWALDRLWVRSRQGTPATPRPLSVP